MNVPKCEAVIYSKRLTNQQILLNHPLPWNFKLKYLGVTLDKEITFQVTYTVRADESAQKTRIVMPNHKRKFRV